MRATCESALGLQGINDSSLNVVRGRVTEELARERFESIYLSNRFLVVRAMSPFYRDTRLAAQQGTFLCPGNVTASFMDNLRGMSGNTQGLAKYVIPRHLHREILYQLYAANVTHSTLFPGLDGFSRMLAVYHQTAWG